MAVCWLIINFGKRYVYNNCGSVCLFIDASFCYLKFFLFLENNSLLYL